MITLPNGNAILNQNDFSGNISDFSKGGADNEYAFGRSIDTRSSPHEVTLLPATVKESGSTILALPKDGDLVGDTLYYYDEAGNIYTRNPVGTHTLVRAVTSSHGNGMKYYMEDKFLYYTGDKTIGRCGQLTQDFAWFEEWESINSAVWNNWGGANITVANKQLTITGTAAAAYYGIEHGAINLTNTYCVSKLISAGDQTLATWQVHPVVFWKDADNQFFWIINAGGLYAQKIIGGTRTTLATVTYDVNIHRYFRIRESGGMIYFDYSTDSYIWINFASLATPFDITNIIPLLICGTYDVETSATQAIYKEFSIGTVINNPIFTDDFMGAEGGVPLNTHWLDLESGSTQYASRADTATLSITGDLAIEATIKPESLPTVGNSMVIASKWDINTNLRSYKFEICTVSGYFGSGIDGALTISANTTEAPIDSSCYGNNGSYALTATNASFAAGQIILIHQTQGSGAGTQQRNKIISYTAGTITLETALNATYSTGAQVRTLKQYSNVTVNSGITYTAKAWNGTVGGILAFLASGTVTVTGTITATGKGFRQAAGPTANNSGSQGEGTIGAGAVSTAANGNGGGGGQCVSGLSAAGGGGGHALTGSTGSNAGSAIGGTGGGTTGTIDLTTMTFGGAGGRAGASSQGNENTAIGHGGGIILITGAAVTVSGVISSSGANGTAGATSNQAGSGGGAGGSILVKAQTATLGATLLTSSAGLGGAGVDSNPAGGAGSVGRIHLDYYTSYTGTTSPTLNATQDNTLITTTTYQLRLGLSSDGTAVEYLTRAANLVAAQTNHVAVSWDASDHEAQFFVDGASIGSMTGAFTSLNDNASKFGLGADFNGATPTNLYDGKIDEVRVWNTERTTAQFYNNKSVQIAANSAGLKAYYQLNNAVTDSTSNANDLTASGSPVYATDVPFSSPTARQDLDQSLDTSGQTYTLQTVISETAANRQTFVPTKEPQKSIEVLVAAVGTGNWTITVHDSLNRVVASLTVANAGMNTGDYEFVFGSAWRPILGASYHFHLTSTVADGTVTTTTTVDLETVDFHTYYQFLVNDTDYHPMTQMLNFLVIGNERYLAKYSASGTYEPHRLSFPSGWRIRCFAFWQNYIVIGFWKSTNIYDTDQGAIAFWDGTSDTYNKFLPIPEGAINAMLGAKGKLHIWAGYHGDKYVYNGGDSVDELETKRVPKMSNDTYIETMPKAVGMWDGLLRWGVAGVSDSEEVERGVYTWGKTKAGSSDSLSYDYPISTGNRVSTNVKAGFVFPTAKKLLVGYQDGLSYGMDVVNPAGSPFATGTIERNIENAGVLWKKKKALIVRADFKPLNSGESIKLKYKIDEAGSWTEGATNNEKGLANTAGDTECRLQIPYGDYKSLQVAVDLATGVSTAPVLEEISYELNPNKSQNII